MNQRQVSRVAYGLLQWLGDVGGLIDGVFLIAEAIVLPFASLALKQKLASNLVRYEGHKSLQQSQKIALSNAQFLAKLRSDENMLERPKETSYIQYLLDKWRNTRNEKMLKNSMDRISQEMDLLRVLNRLRVPMYTALAFMSRSQRVVVDRLRQIRVRETSEEDFEDDHHHSAKERADRDKKRKKELLQAVDQLDDSSKPIDKRLIQLLKWNSGHQSISKTVLTEGDSHDDGVNNTNQEVLNNQQPPHSELEVEAATQLLSDYNIATRQIIEGLAVYRRKNKIQLEPESDQEE